MSKRFPNTYIEVIFKDDKESRTVEGVYDLDLAPSCRSCLEPNVVWGTTVAIAMQTYDKHGIIPGSIEIKGECQGRELVLGKRVCGLTLEAATVHDQDMKHIEDIPLQP